MGKHIPAHKPLKRPFTYPDKNYFVNTGFYLAYKKIFSWPKFRREQVLNKVFISERVVEIPFALKHLSSLACGAQVLDLGVRRKPMPLMEATVAQIKDIADASAATLAVGLVAAIK